MNIECSAYHKFWLLCILNLVPIIFHGDFVGRWWPELPVVLSIFYTTVIMGDVLFHIYKQEKASSRYTGGSNKFFKMMLKQALLFVGAFYITWTPYLVLQVSEDAMICFIHPESSASSELCFLCISTCCHQEKGTACMDSY